MLGDWSIKDNMAHLRAWQQRSIARIEAARLNRAPEFPRWLPDSDPDAPDNTGKANDWIYQANRDRSWTEINLEWREGFLGFLALAEDISERDLLDSSKYPWLEGHPLADVLLASYDHHQEHLDKVLAGLSSPRGEAKAH